MGIRERAWMERRIIEAATSLVRSSPRRGVTQLEECWPRCVAKVPIRHRTHVDRVRAGDAANASPPARPRPRGLKIAAARRIEEETP